MGSSGLRQSLRLQLGVSRKLTAIRWIGQWVVRIHISRVTARGCVYSKADEGAEKSCVVRSGATRRKRGLRRGKSRSRGRQPRRSLKPSAPLTKEVSERSINHHLRGLDFWYGRVDSFRKRVGRCGKSGLSDRGNEVYREQRASWLALSNRIPSDIRGFTGVGDTFDYFLEKHFGIEKYNINANAVLREWAEDIRKLDLPLAEPIPRPGRCVFSFICDWCHISWVHTGPSMRCPDCRRTCVASNLHRGKRNMRRTGRRSRAF